MEKILIEFLNTLDSSFKKVQTEVSKTSGISQLTISQFQYIDVIHELEHPTITEIAKKLDIAKASVSAGVNKLITQGYVIKIQSAEDKRIFYLSLTEQGQQLIKAKYLALQEYGDFITAALSEEEVSQLKTILTKLVQIFRQA